MYPFTVLVLCVQGYLIQSAMSQQQCGCGSSIYNGYNLGDLSNSINVAAPSINLGGANLLGSYGLNSVSSGSCATYGGVGTGQVGVAGEVGACGNTVVVGSVPVLGAVEFGGVLPATGSVSISGQCGCQCN